MSPALLYLLVLPTGIVAAKCPTPIRELQTEAEWTKQDQLAYDTARHGCPRQKPQSPCMIRFIRVEHGTYRVICGVAR